MAVMSSTYFDLQQNKRQSARQTFHAPCNPITLYPREGCRGFPMRNGL
jgi:hypothetical protein